MVVDGDGASATRRRRERMRSWFRHEQQATRMALATALHHSFDRVHAEYGGSTEPDLCHQGLGGREGVRCSTRPSSRGPPSPAGAFQPPTPSGGAARGIA